jgi:hypothetical protein
MEGNTTMLVWLGKNWLGQTDKEVSVEDETTPQKVQIEVVDARKR